jgi:regulation of enolase protein 1 (concanavalin A-like superfamily)
MPFGLPAPRVTADIGSVGLAGSANWDAGTYTISGSGAGVYASSDAFRYVYQPSNGDCSITVRVQSLTNTTVSAKTGVMIRESLAANARCAGVYVTPSSGIQFIWRSTAGSMVSIATKTGLVAPYWVRITRTGNTFKAFYSSNSSSWTQLSTNKSISMAASSYLGTAVTSGTTSASSTGVITNESAVP